MAKEEIAEITKHIETHAKREPHAIHITEILRKAAAELALSSEIGKDYWAILEGELRMTDEEIAEEWLDKRYLKDMGVRRPCKQAFLAGIKLGRPKWHKVANGDLPKNRRNVWVTYINAYYQTETTEASYRHKYWVIDGHKTDCEVIAWCEIPKYTEE